ncbi:MAG TPA: hypothetical protein VFH51_17420 [Myxococcota bacterium]|nr:hypothetical protein [Myxococcota bacterium]
MLPLTRTPGYAPLPTAEPEPLGGRNGADDVEAVPLRSLSPGDGEGMRGPTPPPTVRPSLASSLGRYGALLRGPAYGTGLAMMLGSSMATGIGGTAVLLLVGAAGGHGAALPIFAVTAIDWLDETGRNASRVQAMHVRDVEDMNPQNRGSRAKRAVIAGRMARYGAVQVGCMGVTLGACAGFGRGGLSNSAVIVLAAVAKAVQGYCAIRERGMFDCLKVHLGDGGARAEQARLSRTIQATEVFAHRNIERAVPALLFLAVSHTANGREHPAAAAAGLLITACLLGAGTRLYFAHVAWRAEAL